MLKPFEGICYRIVLSAWDPLSTEGSRLYGGRWNRPGRGALYLSLTKEAAAREVVRSFIRAALKIKLEKVNKETLEKVEKRADWKDVQNARFWIAEIACRVERVLDLTDRQTLRKLKIKEETLKAEWNRTQRLAESWCKRLQLQAVLYPSVLEPAEKHLCLLDVSLIGKTVILIKKEKSNLSELIRMIKK